jgi:hypothetical protein
VHTFEHILVGLNVGLTVGPGFPMALLLAFNTRLFSTRLIDAIHLTNDPTNFDS